MHGATALGPVSVLSVSGRIATETFPQLVSEVTSLLDRGYVNVVFDLGQTDYISSGGLTRHVWRALQTITGQTVARDGRVVLCCVQEQVAQVLQMVGFDVFLEIYPDVTAAKASFGGP